MSGNWRFDALICHLAVLNGIRTPTQAELGVMSARLETVFGRDVLNAAETARAANLPPFTAERREQAIEKVLANESLSPSGQEEPSRQAVAIFGLMSALAKESDERRVDELAGILAIILTELAPKMVAVA